MRRANHGIRAAVKPQIQQGNTMKSQTDMIAEIETKANDLIMSLSKQRDGAMNAIVQLEAAIAAKDRELAKANARISVLEAEATKSIDSEPDLPLEPRHANGNGVDIHAH